MDNRNNHENMFLNCFHDDPAVNLSLELFLRMIHQELGDSLLSVLLYGSILFDDLAPGVGDLDFLAVVRDGLDEAARARLIALRAPLRSGHYGVHCQMLEGPFLSAAMLGPKSPGRALCWGTGGERQWEKNELDLLNLYLIRERGLVIWGEDVRLRIPEIQRRDILAEMLATTRNMRQYTKPSSLQSLGFLFTPARELLWLKEGRFSSKSEAADWGFQHAQGEWRKHLPRAKFLRHNPLAADCRDVREWIAGLGAAMLEAADELEQELVKALED